MPTEGDLPTESKQEPTPLSRESAEWGLYIFLALAVGALALPFAVLPIIGVYWTAVIAVVVCIIWFRVMPTTCINGAFVCSLMAMMILVNAISMIVIAIAHWLRRGI